MVYLFYKVLEFLSNASQCAPTKKVVDLIISATAIIRPHQKFCVSGRPTGCNFSQTGIFWSYNTLCCEAYPSFTEGMYTLCMYMHDYTE